MRWSDSHNAPTEKTTISVSSPRLDAAHLIAAALWLGLAYGLLEGLGYSLLRLLPWAASPVNGTTLAILWIGPLEYATAFGLVGCLFAAVHRGLARVRVDVALVSLLAGLCAFLVVDLQDHVIANYASAALGAGVALQTGRQYRRNAGRWLAAMHSTLPYLGGLIVFLAAAVTGGSWLLEHLHMRSVAMASEARPSVLLLVLDTQRADHLSSYGYARRTTPRLDQLAHEGVLFERAHSASSWTLPSHASMMTGRPPREHRAGDPLRPFLDGRHTTLAEVLRRAGYATGGFVANSYWAGRQMGLSRGFTRYEDQFMTFADAAFKPVLGRRLAWDAVPMLGVVKLPARPAADVMNERLLAWLDRVGSRPFFAFVNYMDVHGPYLAPPPYDSMFATTPATQATEYELAPTNDETAARMHAKLQESLDAYDGSLAFLDHQIGRLLDALAARNLASNTLVIVTSDHGESFGEHGLVNHGNSIYLHQTHVPLIMRFPGRLPPGVRHVRPVSLTRLGDTVLDLVGQRHQSFAGSSFLSTAQHGDSILTEVARRRQVPKRWPTSRGWTRAVITERWHFIVNEAGDEELYDLDNDRGEERNIAGDAAWNATVVRLRAELERMTNGRADRWARAE